MDKAVYSILDQCIIVHGFLMLDHSLFLSAVYFCACAIQTVEGVLHSCMTIGAMHSLNVYHFGFSNMTELSWFFHNHRATTATASSPLKCATVL